MKYAKRQAGFSLIELMISAALVLIVMTVVTSTFSAQNKTYVVVDQLSEAQQTLRAVVDLIEQDARRGGYMVPGNAGICGWDLVNGPDTLFISNGNVIGSVLALETCLLDTSCNLAEANLSGRFGAPVAGVNSSFTASGTGTINLDRMWVDIEDADGDSAADVDFAVNEGVILVNRQDLDDPVACGLITSVGSSSLSVDWGSTTFGPAGTCPNPDGCVVAIPAHVYQVSVGTPNQLTRSSTLVASDVEDFQVTYFFDDDDDLVQDTGEMFGTAGGTARPWELTPTANRPDFSSLREIGINIVTVTRTDDPNREWNIGAGQITGNRTTGLPTADGKRRRVSTTRVRLRNQGS